MVLSYTVSVILLSFAMFGIWCFGRDIWIWLVAPYISRKPKISFLVLVKNIEHDIEEMLRHLMLAIDISGNECEVIVIDCGSEDMTLRIVSRLSREFHSLISLQQENVPNGINDALPYCAGGVIHILDTVHRVDPENFQAVVYWLMKQDNGHCD